MNAEIKILDDHLINKIAAGEVVESPSSVVKELIENSIDAGATKIKIEIKGAGLLLIKIDDNGSGMNEVNAKLSIQRHATSKISQINDLHNLSSMGFRGEALASIAAISKLKLITSLDCEGLEINIDAGKVVNIKSVARTKGTTIEVGSLFYNVPVRRNFQKTKGFLIGGINKVVTNLSLAHPNIEFTLISESKEILKCLSERDKDIKNSLQKRILQVFGKDFIDRMDYVFFEEGPFCFYGYIGKPFDAKKNRSLQYTIINKRVVFSPIISTAIKDAYGTRIGDSYYPNYIMHLFMPLDFIDVNVHPQKKEVRIKDAKLLRDMLIQAIENTFKSFFKTSNSAAVVFDSPKFQSTFSLNTTYEENINLPDMVQKDFFSESNLFASVIKVFKHYLLIDKKSISDNIFPDVDGILLVDLKAASARCVYDVLKSQKQKFDLQKLAFPKVIDLEYDEICLIEENLSSFLNAGFEIRIIAEKSIAVDAIATFFQEEDIEKIIFSILEELHLSGDIKISVEKQFIKVIKKIALFVKAKRKIFSNQEAMIIFNQLLKGTDPFVDPYKEPIMNLVSEDDFKKIIQKKISYATN